MMSESTITTTLMDMILSAFVQIMEATEKSKISILSVALRGQALIRPAMVMPFIMSKY